MFYDQYGKGLFFFPILLIKVASGVIDLDVSVPLRDNSVKLTCSISSAQSFFWFNPNFAKALTNCPANQACYPTRYGELGKLFYTFGTLPGQAYVDIVSLNRTRDQAVWRCSDQSNRILLLNLTVFTSPVGINLVSQPPSTDLAETSLIIQCQTERCGYPDPTISWYYQINAEPVLFEEGNPTVANVIGSCTQQEKIYISTLNLTRGTRFPANIPVTAKLLCGITHASLNGTRFTQPSNDVVFAVTLTYVNISGSTDVTQGTPATITCITSISRPKPMVQWFIAGTEMKTGIQNFDRTDSSGLPYVESRLAFDPDGIHYHGKEIYCQAYTITATDYVMSTRPTLNVSVRVTEAVLQQNNRSIADILTFNLEEPVTLTCVTGFSRPDPIIAWYIGTQWRGSVPNLSFTPSNADHNQIIYCQAYNTDPNRAISSLKPRLSVKVYVRNVTLEPPGAIVTFLDGTKNSLRCTTSPSRPQPLIRWWLDVNEFTNVSSTEVSETNTLFVVSSELHLTVDKTNQDKKVYCDAKVNGQVLAVESIKPSINVWYQPSLPSVQTFRGNFPWLENQTGTLQCVMADYGNPKASVMWTSSSITVDKDSNLLFRNLSAYDHGQTVYCQLRNNFTDIKGLTIVSPTVTLNVEYRPIITLSPSEQPVRIKEKSNLTVTCTASGNPQPIVQWKNRNPPSNSFHIPSILRNSTGSYTCVASSTSTNYIGVLLHTEKSASVIVEYAPYVRVDVSGSSVVGSTAVLMCVPQGEPPQYTFHQWIHMAGQTEIRRLAGENTFSTSTLTLSNIRVQDMGTYICTVDNSITGLDGQINQRGDTPVYVQGLPVIGETQSTFTGETNKSASIEIPFYSHPSIKTVKFSKQLDSFEIVNTSDISIYISPSNITMIFYNKKLMIRGQVAVIYFRNVKDTDFDNYTFQLSSGQGSVYMQFDFIAAAPPSMPKKFFFSHSEGSLLIFGIEKGFNGGHEQTFIVEYQPFGMPEATWYTIFKINETDLDSPSAHGSYYFKISKIQDGHYMFRVYAVNRLGNSSTTEGVYVEIKTELLYPVIRDFSVAAVAGGVVGAVVLVIAIVAAVFVVKRRTLKPKIEENMKRVVFDGQGPEYINAAFRSDISTTEYEALQSDRTGASQYEALNDPKSKLNQSTDIRISSDPRPSHGEMFYDKLDPCDTNQGHMYSNLSSPRFDESKPSENKFYENTVIVN